MIEFEAIGDTLSIELLTQTQMNGIVEAHEFRRGIHSARQLVVLDATYQWKSRNSFIEQFVDTRTTIGGVQRAFDQRQCLVIFLDNG
jgi:hypothetical protein